jgi:glycosyltransferase involved in cell wall biosynthesis
VRIVHAADSFAPDIGGIERQVEALALRQSSEGHDVTVITAVHDKADLNLHVARASAGRWLTVAFPWRNHRMVAEILDSSPIDVVHAHFTVVSPLAIYVTRAASRRGIPVAVTVHSLWWKVALATRISTLPFGWGRIRAAWSGVSTVAAGHVGRTLPRVGEVSVVPNLVDVQWWRRPDVGGADGGAPNVGRPDVGGPDVGGPGMDSRNVPAEIRLVLVGRLKKRKHVGEFIAALHLARRRLPAGTRVRVSVVGQGPRRPALLRQIADLGLTDWVCLLGHREPAQIRALLHQSDLFVASSRQESFGIAALEARAGGLPVLGYRGNGLSDFIQDGVDGVLVTDQVSMVDALVRLLGPSPDLDRLNAWTKRTPPSVGVAEAMNAVDALYRRARVMHKSAAGGRKGPALWPPTADARHQPDPPNGPTPGRDGRTALPSPR